MGFIPTGSPLSYGTGSMPVRHQARSRETAQTSPIVFILDEDEAVCESLAHLASSEGWRSQTFTSPEEFLSRTVEHVPSCLILAVSLPGLSGLELQRRLIAERRCVPLIFLGENEDVATSVKAMKAGAVEFFTTPFRIEELLSAIREAHERSRFALACEAEQRLYETLSHRESEVMALLVTGLLNKQVGFELGIKEKTVKAHRGQVMQKMKAASFADLVKMATRLGLGSKFDMYALSQNVNLASILAAQLFRGYALAR